MRSHSEKRHTIEKKIWNHLEAIEKTLKNEKLSEIDQNYYLGLTHAYHACLSLMSFHFTEEDTYLADIE